MGPRNAATTSGHRTQVQNSHFAKPPRFTCDSCAHARRIMWTGGAALPKVAIATWASELQKPRFAPGAVMRISGDLPLLTLPMISPALSWDTLSAHPQRTRESKQLNSHFSKMRFFEAEDGPLQGQSVATVRSFLREIGRKSMAKHVDEHRNVWIKKVAGITEDALARTTLLIQSGGEGYCATKETFKKLYAYL